MGGVGWGRYVVWNAVRWGSGWDCTGALNRPSGKGVLLDACRRRCWSCLEWWVKVLRGTAESGDAIVVMWCLCGSV